MTRRTAQALRNRVILTLGLAALFLVTAAVLAALVDFMMRRQATQEAESKARILLDRALAISAFNTSRDRIKAMALVHDELYAAQDYACIEMAGCLESLGQELLVAHGIGGRKALTV
jgi:two-component sensor histidine kinase